MSEEPILDNRSAEHDPEVESEQRYTHDSLYSTVGMPGGVSKAEMLDKEHGKGNWRFVPLSGYEDEKLFIGRIEVIPENERVPQEQDVPELRPKGLAARLAADRARRKTP